MCVSLSIFSVLGGAGVSKFGHFRALETPGGDLGFKGSILGAQPLGKAGLGVPFLDGGREYSGSADAMVSRLPREGLKDAP